MNALPVYDDQYVNTKMRTYAESFKTISIDSLLVSENKILCKYI